MLNTDNAVRLSANSGVITTDQYLYTRIQTTEHIHFHTHTTSTCTSTRGSGDTERTTETEKERQTQKDRQKMGGVKGREVIFSLFILT